MSLKCCVAGLANGVNHPTLNAFAKVATAAEKSPSQAGRSEKPNGIKHFRKRIKVRRQSQDKSTRRKRLNRMRPAWKGRCFRLSTATSTSSIQSNKDLYGFSGSV
jgi:hypothetical protein